MESELEGKVKAIKERQQQLEEEQKQLWKDLSNAEDQLVEEQMKDITSQLPKYKVKLERIQKYLEGFMKEKGSRYGDTIKYAFRKVEIYKNDFHDPMPDPLNWKIAEYDLLDMDQYVEVIFDYHSEAVKRFVTEWIREHVHYACEEDVEGFFGFSH